MQHVGPARLRSLLDSVLLIGSDLDLQAMLHRIVTCATELTEARYGALGVIDESGTELSDFLTVGVDDNTKARVGDLPHGRGILGLLIVDPRPLRLPNLSEHTESFGFPPNHPPMTSFLGVPIRVRNRVFGNLYLTDKQGGEVFTDIDEEVLVTLASAAGIAIENARLHERVEALAVVQDRERIARDLHDTVIQRLFAAGLSLQGTASIADAVTSQRLNTTIDELDAIIREVRSAIFHLEEPKAQSGLTAAVRAMTGELSRVVGFTIDVQTDDELDSVDLTSDVRHALVATLREALSNVARHANASKASVILNAGEDEVVLRVIDNGVGISDKKAVAGKGIGNAAKRAKTLGGSLSARRDVNGGTIFEWRVPRKTSG